MNKDEYESYRNESPSEPHINIYDQRITRGTLAYGYTVERDTWHAYVYNGEIHVLVTQGRHVLLHEHGESLPASMLKPSKRAYPDAADLRFAQLMRAAGEPLDFLGNFDFDSPGVAERAETAVTTDGYVGDTHITL